MGRSYSRLVLAVAAALSGCSGGSDPALSFSKINHRSMPAFERRIPAPRGLGIGREDRLMVLDSLGRVLVYLADGTLEREWWMPDYSVGRPEGILQLRDGRIAVADTHYHRVVYFDERGNVLSMHGKLGRGPGAFTYPVALTEDDAGGLYVAEYGGNDRVQKFDREGKVSQQFGGFGTGPGEFQRPSGIAWMGGKIYVADAFNNRLQVFSDGGTFLRVLVSSEQGTGLHYPYSLARGPGETLFVVEYGAGRVSQFDAEGRLLGRFGTTGSGENEFATPWALTADGRGTVYVGDTGNGRIVELVP